MRSFSLSLPRAAALTLCSLRNRRVVDPPLQSPLRPLSSPPSLLPLWILPPSLLADREPRFLPRRRSKGLDPRQARDMANSVRMVKDRVGSRCRSRPRRDACVVRRHLHSCWARNADGVRFRSVDFLAPKAKQNSWFLSMLEALSTAYPDMRIQSYPGLAYAKALCLRGLEEEASEVSPASRIRALPC